MRSFEIFTDDELGIIWLGFFCMAFPFYFHERSIGDQLNVMGLPKLKRPENDKNSRCGKNWHIDGE